MSRQLKLSEERISKLLVDLKGLLEGKTFFDDDFKLHVLTDQYEDRKAVVNFTASAYLKMSMLVNSFDSEVAWHGTVERNENEFTIKDIFVYPQNVTGATVNTDQDKYEQWLMQLDDDDFNTLRMQGHSHVNMGTSPSSVDLSHQERIVEQLDDNDYYIFMIWNKKGEHTIKIFDMLTNTFYDDDDVTVNIEGGDLLSGFLKEANQLVTKTYYNAYEYKKPTGNKEEDKNTKKSKPTKWEDYYDDDDYFYAEAAHKKWDSFFDKFPGSHR